MQARHAARAHACMPLQACRALQAEARQRAYGGHGGQGRKRGEEKNPRVERYLLAKMNFNKPLQLNTAIGLLKASIQIIS
jgi:hypothetical protein